MSSQGPRYAVIKNFLASAARTTSGRSSWFKVGEGDKIIIFVDVSAVSGDSPTLDIVVEGAPDDTIASDTDAWALKSFTQITATGKPFELITHMGKYLRIKYTIGGTTPSFTFKVTGVLES